MVRLHDDVDHFSHIRDNPDHLGRMAHCVPCQFTLKFVVLIGVASAIFGIFIGFCLRSFLKLVRRNRSNLDENQPDRLFRCFPVSHPGCLGPDHRHAQHGGSCPCQSGQYIPQQPPPYLSSAAEGQDVGWSARPRLPSLLLPRHSTDCGGAPCTLSGRTEPYPHQQQHHHHQHRDHHNHQQQHQRSALASEHGSECSRSTRMLQLSPPRQESESCSHGSRMTPANSTGSIYQTCMPGHQSRCHCSTSNLSPVVSESLEYRLSPNGQDEEAVADTETIREDPALPELPSSEETITSERGAVATTQTATTLLGRETLPQTINRNTCGSRVTQIKSCPRTQNACIEDEDFHESPCQDVQPDAIADFTSPHVARDAGEFALGEVEMRIMNRESSVDMLSDANLIATLTNAPPLTNPSFVASNDENPLNDIASDPQHGSSTGDSIPTRRNVQLEAPVPGFNRTSVFNFNTFPIIKDDKTVSLPQPREDEEGNDSGGDEELTRVKDFIHRYLDDPFDPTTTSRTTIHNGKLIVYAMKALDHRGGELHLDYVGIALRVPEGALPKGPAHFVSLVLNWNLSDSPKLDSRTALVGPVVYCGPHGMHFQKPCTLCFRHCAHDPRCVKILSSDTGLFDTMSWKRYYSAEIEDEECQTDLGDNCKLKTEEEENTVNLTADECQVQVSHFSLYTCVQWAKHRRLKKWLQVAVFCRDLDPAFEHHQFRVYFLNKTPCALQWALQNEAKHHFRLACPETTFLFEECGEDMRMALSYLSEGWEMVSSDDRVQFQHIWHGECPHVCLAFRRHQSSLMQQRRKAEDSKLNDMQVAIEDEKKSDVTSRVAETSPPRNRLLEINVNLKLCQERSENSVTHVNVLAYELDGRQLVHREQSGCLDGEGNSPKQLEVCVSVEKEKQATQKALI